VDVTGQVLSTFTDVTLVASLDSEGRVLVADCCNHRILLLSSELQRQRGTLVPGGLKLTIFSCTLEGSSRVALSFSHAAPDSFDDFLRTVLS